MDAAKKDDPDTAGRILWSKYMNKRNWQPEPTYGDTGTKPPPEVDAGVEVDAGAPVDAGSVMPDASGTGGSGGTTGGSGGGDHPAGGSGGTGGGSGSDDESTPPSRKAQSGGCSFVGVDHGPGLLVLALALATMARRRR